MTAETAKILKEYLIPQVKQESAITRKVLAAVPSDQSGYKPSEKCMSGLELASHIAVAEAFFLRGVINGAFEWKPEEHKTIADVLAFYDGTVQPLFDKLEEVSPESLAKDVTFAVFTQPAVTYLSFHLAHGTHHRGQLSAYLRPMGAKVPSIYGPSADEQPQSSAASN